MNESTGLGWIGRVDSQLWEWGHENEITLFTTPAFACCGVDFVFFGYVLICEGNADVRGKVLARFSMAKPSKEA